MTMPLLTCNHVFKSSFRCCSWQNPSRPVTSLFSPALPPTHRPSASSVQRRPPWKCISTTPSQHYEWMTWLPGWRYRRPLFWQFSRISCVRIIYLCCLICILHPFLCCSSLFLLLNSISNIGQRTHQSACTQRNAPLLPSSGWLISIPDLFTFVTWLDERRWLVVCWLCLLSATFWSLLRLADPVDPWSEGKRFARDVWSVPPTPVSHRRGLGYNRARVRPS